MVDHNLLFVVDSLEEFLSVSQFVVGIVM